MDKLLDGKTRREMVEQILIDATEPVSGSSLSKQLKVSRQVIVQDIALLRANGKSVISTTKGYVLFHSNDKTYKDAYTVRHSKDDIEDELNTIVDFGGRVLNVIVEHSIYGFINVDLIINNREDVKDFVKQCNHTDSIPLMQLTNGVHIHTVEADTEDTLNKIRDELDRKGYLVK